MRINLKAKGENQKLVLAYLEENASDVLVEKINSGKKTMDDCWNFIMKCAEKELNKKNGAIRDDVVFGWAVHFFEEDSIKEGEKIKAPAETVKATPTGMKKVQPEPKKEKKEPKKEEAVQLEGQITLFDFIGGQK